MSQLQPKPVEVIIALVEDDEESGVDQSDLSADVEFCEQEEQSKVVVACDLPPKWTGIGVGIWQAE